MEHLDEVSLAVVAVDFAKAGGGTISLCVQARAGMGGAGTGLVVGGRGRVSSGVEAAPTDSVGCLSSLAEVVAAAGALLKGAVRGSGKGCRGKRFPHALAARI